MEINTVVRTKFGVYNVLVVWEFSNVFLEDLPSLPLDSELEFKILLLSGSALVSIPLCRKAPTKLKVLKAQLQDLVDKGFIRWNMFSKNWFKVKFSIYRDFEILRWIFNESLIIVLNYILLRWEYEM